MRLRPVRQDGPEAPLTVVCCVRAGLILCSPQQVGIKQGECLSSPFVPDTLVQVASHLMRSLPQSRGESACNKQWSNSADRPRYSGLCSVIPYTLSAASRGGVLGAGVAKRARDRPSESKKTKRS